MLEPSDSSAVEPLNETPKPSQPASGTEWAAIGLGLIVGMCWWATQSVLFSFFYSYAARKYGSSFFSSSSFTVISTILSVILPIVYGTIVGFSVGYKARRPPYLPTVVVSILLFAFTSFKTFLDLRALPVGPPLTPLLLWTALALVLLLAGALNGAFIAQSVKRNRGVRIQ